MRPTSTVELSTGMFVLLGFAALFFMVTQITNRELSSSGKSYELMAQFENIGSLKPGAAHHAEDPRRVHGHQLDES